MSGSELYDDQGTEIARSALTKHPGEMSWAVTRAFEGAFQKDGPMIRESYRVTISREEPWWVAAVDGVGATEAKKLAELSHEPGRRQARSNSPSSTPAVNAVHSSGVKISAGPSGFLLSRRAMT